MAPHVPQRENLNAPPVQLDDVFAGEKMIATQVCRSDREVETFGATWREALALKGWR